MIVIAVNHYVYNLLKRNNDWGYAGRNKELFPVIPAAQIPQVKDSKAPYIVYSSSLEYNDGELGQVRGEIINYVLYGDGDDLEKAMETLVGLFTSENVGRYINDWLADERPGTEWLTDEDESLRVMWTEVLDTESPDVYDEQEGGDKSAFISIRVRYKVSPDKSEEELYAL